MSIIELDKWKEENSEHISGTARCTYCRHEWEAVAPLETNILQCPKCFLQRGYFKTIIQRSEPHWKCNCGNFLFFITPSGYYCPICGVATNA